MRLPCRFGTSAVTVLFAVGLMASVTAADDLGGNPQVKEKNGMSYMSGGVGSEEKDALMLSSRPFNLKVTFATEHGKYLGGGPVRIEDASGKTLLDATSDGPLFFVKLPPGRYKIFATVNDRPLSRSVEVSTERQVEVAFVWPDAAGESSRAGDAPAADSKYPSRVGQEAPAAHDGM